MPDTVAVVAVGFVAFGIRCWCYRLGLGHNIAAHFVDFGDYSDIVVGIDEFHEFVALE